MVAAARRARSTGARSFGIVTSGRALDDREFDRVAETVARITDELGMRVCASLGEIDRPRAERLAAAGLGRYNHNLETSRARYAEVATTHTHADRVRSVAAVKEAGLEACSGGIFGLGETMADRLDLFGELRALEVDCVPLNFLVPVAGTPFESRPRVPPLEALATVAAARMMFAGGDVKLAGGREHHLGEFQSWMFYAGASSFIIGDYLTTRGRGPAEDLKLIEDLGLVLEDPAGARLVGGEVQGSRVEGRIR
jgi:biotin synthase